MRIGAPLSARNPGIIPRFCDFARNLHDERLAPAAAIANGRPHPSVRLIRGHCPKSPSRPRFDPATMRGMQAARRSQKWRGPLTLLAESRRFRCAIFVALAIPVLYVASFGPACWISSRLVWTATAVGIWAVAAVDLAYAPLMWIWSVGPEPVGDFLEWYSTIGTDGRWHGNWHWMKNDQWEWAGFLS